MSDALKHYGIKRKSGRYPWGSGENPYQRDNKGFLARYHELKKKYGEKEAAKMMGLTMRELRAKVSSAKNEKIKEDMQMVYQLRYKKQMSPEAIAERLGLSESTVRNYLKPQAAERLKDRMQVVDQLRSEVDNKGYIDVGKGSNFALGITQDKLEKTLDILKEEGYTVKTIKVQQMATGQYTTVKVLAKPGTTARDIYQHQQDIKPLGQQVIFDTDGTTKLGIKPPVSVDSKRLKINYADDGSGGQDKDGVIEIRRGCEDLNLGKGNYAQVRIAIDDKYYLKGMAVYKDGKDMPEGVDIIFNTSKSKEKGMDALKKLNKDNPENPFGATILQDKDLRMAQQMYIDSKTGEEKQSALNIVTEEGKWDSWSKTLASQFLSKQSTELAQKQLNLAASYSRSELDDITKLTNPVLKKKLLEEYANGADADAAHLKAAALPRQSTKVILPVPSIKENEIYAPSYKDGETVVLIRYPHAGPFELSELKVNNSNKEGREVLGTTPTDAVGIHPKAAAKLSGADFDGDTVVVIPVKNANGVRTVGIKTADSLPGLKDWDFHALYKLPDDAPPVKTKTKNQEMGIITNLITDMSLKGADLDEIERAVKHSMVVIDAEKHHLDIKKSAIDNNIAELHEKWQGKKSGGASTIVSKAESQEHLPTVKDYYKIDPNTGEKVTTLTGAMRLKPSVSYSKMTPEQKKAYNRADNAYRKTGVVPEGKIEGMSFKEVPVTYKTTKMAATTDARTLVSPNPHPMELVYADYANTMKALANEARKEIVSIKMDKASPSAAKTYAKEVESLNNKLIEAQRNAPRERQAQIYANSVVSAQLKANPDLKYDNDKLKKIKNQALSSARSRFGADKKKVQITLTENEWKAIQSNAISPTKQKEIFDNCDSDLLKQLATPKNNNVTLTSAKIAKIKAMKASNYTMAEIAKELGVSTSTVSKAINGT